MKNSILGRIAPSVKSLCTIKDVTRDDAMAIRKAWRTIGNRQDAREAIDSILCTHGIEYLGYHKRNCQHVYYCNSGDTYSTTIIFCGLRAYVGCWGDLVEKNIIATQ